MKIRAEALPQQLQKQLAPIYLVAGDEPLLVQEACSQIRRKVRAVGITDREVFDVTARFDWQNFLAASASGSLFSEKSLLELRCASAKPGDKGAKAFVRYVEHCPADKILLITMPKLDAAAQRSKWFKTLDRLAIFVPIWPIEINRLPQWIKTRAQAKGLQLEPAAVQFLADRVEGNLHAAHQEIIKLQLQYGEGRISLSQMQAAISDSARFDAFSLVDVALSGQGERSLRMMRGLKAEGEALHLLLWALAREVRQLYQMAQGVAAGKSIANVLAEYRVWDNRKAIVGKALQKHNLATLSKMVQQLAVIDRISKGMQVGNAWLELESVLLGLAGVLSLPSS